MARLVRTTICRCLNSFLLISLVVLPAEARPRKGLKTAATNSVHEAAIVAKQARAYYDKKDFALAAELYDRAYVLNPARPEYLYGVGRARQMAGRLEDARMALERLQALLPQNHPLQQKAEKSLKEIADAEKAKPPIVIAEPVQVTPTVVQVVEIPQVVTPVVALAPPPTPTQPQVPAPVEMQVVKPAEILSDSNNFGANATIIGGAALGVLGIGLSIWARVEQNALADDLGKVRGPEAASRQREINNLSTASLVSSVVGAGALALGLYWRLGEHRAQPVLTASPTWVGLAWRL